MEFDTHELAWAAGFFDGEGNSILREFNVAAINIGQKDRFVLDRFQKAIGSFGSIGLHKNGRDGYGEVKWIWRYQTAKSEYVQHIMCMLWRWLGPIKKKQIKDVMVQQIRDAKVNNYSMTRQALYCREARKYGTKAERYWKLKREAESNKDNNKPIFNPFKK